MRMRYLLILAAVAVFTIVAPRPASAWGFEAHEFIMARVIPLLPAEIRPFFTKYEKSIVEHTIEAAL